MAATVLTAAVQPALVTLAPGRQRLAMMTGRSQPIADTIASALRDGQVATSNGGLPKLRSLALH